MMNINSILTKKIKKKTLTKEEIYFFVESSVKNKIKDYQISTMLNAIFFNGMNFNETYWLTLAMKDSGYKYDSKIDRVDKHSTGGVGDKVTLILAPIVASFGIPLFKISGRGLGFTGGTIDKLESINVNTSFSFKKAKEILKNNKMSIIEQTSDIVPADKIFYSIRNDTSTIESLPLIISSIMSKKLALGSNHIYLDIKIGDGALFKNIASAKEFASACIKIGKKENKKVICYFTNMNEPLGKYIGNKLEVIEALDFLQCNFESKNLKKLIFKICSDILIDFKISKSFVESKKLLNQKLESLEPFNKFIKWAHDQESNISFNEFKKLKFNPKNKISIKASKAGYFNIKSTLLLGEIVFNLGGGRVDKDSKIDYDAGIHMMVENGDIVKKDQTILKIYSNSPISKSIIEDVYKSYEIKSSQASRRKIILGEVK